MIGNAHIDPIWLWRMQEGYEEVISTCRSALNRMKETQEFIFTRSSAAMYKWIEEGEPEMFEEIRNRVKEGRWNIVNGWWVQPDCNIPCGESFVRQALYGKQYFMDKFGVDVKVGYNVDSFGHCATLPQILKKSGLDYYVFFRPKPNEKRLPSLFWWESPDGTGILTSRPPHHYNTGPDEIEERIYQAYEKTSPNVKDVMCFYGVGNHGGGPTKKNIESIKRAKAKDDYPTVIFSTPDNFFDRVLSKREDFPVVADELQYHSRGCYTAYSEVKRKNRMSECLLMDAEKFSSIAHWMLGTTYPQAELTEAWQNVLFNQFHDILAGTSIKSAYDKDVNKLYADVFESGRNVLSHSLKSLTEAMNLPEARNVVVFNSMNWRRKEGVEVNIESEKFHLLDSQGKEVPYQFVDKGRLAFLADVPPLGWSSYRILPSEEVPEFNSEVEITQTKIENSFYSIELDYETGFIRSIFDKVRNIEMLSDMANVPIVIDDQSDTWSHGVDAFRNEIGKFLIEGDVEIIETGPVRVTLKVKSQWGNSKIETLIILWEGIPRIDFQMTVDWHEKHKMLKLSFPINIDAPTATYEVPYGNVVRVANGNEEPNQFFIDVTGTAKDSDSEHFTYGVSLINNCKYGSDIKESEMRLSVLRGPIYAFHDPAVIDPNKTYDYTDQGIQTLKYTLYSHGKDWLEETVREGFSFNYPLIPIVVDGHEGKLPEKFSFIDLMPDNLVLTTLKKAEDDDSLIFRLYETSGENCNAKLKIPPEGFLAEVPFGRYEIKTLNLFKAEGKIKLKETDLLERSCEII